MVYSLMGYNTFQGLMKWMDSNPFFMISRLYPAYKAPDGYYLRITSFLPFWWMDSSQPEILEELETNWTEHREKFHLIILRSIVGDS